MNSRVGLSKRRTAATSTRIKLPVRSCQRSFVLLLLWCASARLLAQNTPNCFLEDFVPKTAVIPAFEAADKPSTTPSVTVTIANDTLGKISKYVFGNAVAVWVGTNLNNPTVVSQLQQLAPTLIRFPGGSWSDIYFWKGNPGDLPAKIWSWDGNTGKWTLTGFAPQLSSWYPLTVDQYYSLRQQIGAQGLITINYAYARYGTSAHPANQAAHYAADWVRYDNGRTKFWEIGNEDGGPWEAGWRIDTATNKDGQPDTITGALYGKHFKIFVDSMKAAAAEAGATIYIGAQINNFDGTNGWNVVDRTFNAGVFSEVGDSPDFYVEHNYLGGGYDYLKNQVDAARQAINDNITFIHKDIAAKGALSKPVALTEWNSGGPDSVYTSTINGVEAVVAYSEMIKNNYGMSCRWLLASQEKDGMFCYKVPADPGVPLWNPRPDFYYLSYLQRFTGDHTVSTTVTTSPVYNDMLAYATRFASGELGVVVVNKNKTDKVVKLATGNIGVGNRFYVYSLTGANNDKYGKSQTVVVNGIGPTSVPWGPGPQNLDGIKAWGYPIGSQISFASPAFSVQYVMIESGSNVVSVGNEKQPVIVDRFALHQNYPNPFNPSTTISFSLPSTSFVTVKVFDVMGREVATIVNEEVPAGNHSKQWVAEGLSSGVYFYRLQAGKYSETKKLTLLK